MKLRRNRNDWWCIACLLGLTLLWVFFGLYWAFQPAFTDFSGLGNDSELERIYARFPSYLVNPATIGIPENEVLLPWCVAEFKLRLSLVAGGWLLAVVALGLVRRRFRSRVLRVETWKVSVRP